MKQPRIHAALIVVASGLIASSMARTCPVESEAAVKLAALGGAFVAIEVAFPLHLASRDAGTLTPEQPAGTPLALDGDAQSALIHPAIFADFDFAAAQDRSGRAAGR